MTIVLRLTRSQQMALSLILVEYARQPESIQEFHDMTNDDHVTTLGELMTMVNDLREVEAERRQPFPIFNLGPEGETQYQTYHRGFRDGWKAAQ